MHNDFTNSAGVCGLTINCRFTIKRVSSSSKAH
jgi:hypothetical protein